MAVSSTNPNQHPEVKSTPSSLPSLSSKFSLPLLRLFLVLFLFIALVFTLSTSSSLTLSLTRNTSSKTYVWSDTINEQTNITTVSSEPHRFSPFRSFLSIFDFRSAPPPQRANYSLTNLPPSLNQYMEWHAKHRACIEQVNCSEPLPPTLIWRCPFNKTCAGLGDRVRGIQISFLVAIASRRLFFIDMPSIPFPFTDVVSPSLVDWRIPEPLSIQRPNETWPYLDWFHCNRRPAPNGKRRCRRGKKLPHDRALPHVNISFQDIDSYRQDITSRLSNVPHMTTSCRLPETIIHRLFRNKKFLKNAYLNIKELRTELISTNSLSQLLMHLLFQPSEDVQAVINTTTTADFVSQGYIGVHARTGQDVGEHRDKRFEFVNTHILHAVRELLQCARLMHPLASERIFIATDSMQFKSLFVQLATGTLNQTTITELTANETLPLDDIKQFIDENHKPIDVRFINRRAYHFGLKTPRGKYRNKFRYKSNKKRAFVSVFADLFMLGGSEAILTTGSGFASTGFWLGHSKSLLEAEPGNGTDHCAKLQTNEGL